MLRRRPEAGQQRCQGADVEWVHEGKVGKSLALNPGGSDVTGEECGCR